MPAKRFWSSLYVEVAAGDAYTVARRSDGSVVAWGRDIEGQTDVPALPPGLTYIDVAAGYDHTVARIGPEQSYVTFGAGCAGSLGITRLIPISLPRLGETLTVNLDNLPLDQAILILGFSETTSVFGPLPLDLSPFGIQGCTGRVSPDFAWLVSGTGSWATGNLLIPSFPVLLGIRFYQQALIFNPASGNPAGVVISDAAVGVVGR